MACIRILLLAMNKVFYNAIDNINQMNIHQTIKPPGGYFMEPAINGQHIGVIKMKMLTSAIA